MISLTCKSTTRRFCCRKVIAVSAASSSSSSSAGLFRTTPLLFAGIRPPSFDQMKASYENKPRWGYGEIDPDRMEEFNNMQTAKSAKKTIEQEKQRRAAFLQLPKEDQIRQFMLEQRKFDVDLVRKNGMDVKTEFARHNLELETRTKRSTRNFWGTMIFTTFCVFFPSFYMVFSWY